MDNNGSTNVKESDTMIIGVKERLDGQKTTLVKKTA